MIRIRLRVKSQEAKDALARKHGSVRKAVEGFRGRGGQLVRGVMVRVIRERQKAGMGLLSNSVQVFPTTTGFVVAATAGYAGFVDKPTRPHVIRPVRARALAFPRAGGQITRSNATGHVRTRFTFGGRSTTTGAVFAAYVFHPGTKGMDFTGETARRVPGLLDALMADEVRSALEAA